MVESIIETFAPRTAQMLGTAHPRPSDRVSVEVSDDLRFFFLRPYSMRGGDVVGPPSLGMSSSTIAKRFPEYHFVNVGLRIPTTDTSSIILTSIFNDDTLVLSEDARSVLEHRLALFYRQSKCAGLQAKSQQKVPFTERKFAARPDVEYMPHQLYAAHAAIGNPSYALFMEQGTGKTLVVIMRMDVESLMMVRTYRVLVICPQSVRSNWRNEFSEFSTTKGEVIQLRGGKLKRQKLLLDSLRVKNVDWVTCIISYDSMVRTAESLSALPWDLIIADESHYFKSVNTRRSKHIHKLRDSAAARMCLTGTPIVNGPADLYAQLEFLGEGCSGFSSGKNFKTFYHKYKQVTDSHTIFLGAQNVPFLQERLARYSFLATTEEVMPDLPKLSYQIEEVEMTTTQKEIYKKVANQIRIEVESELEESDNYAMTINHVFTRLLRLAQITSGFVTYDPVIDFENGEILEQRHIDRLDPNPKLDAMMDFIKKTPKGDKSIVWACWVQDIKTIDATLTEEGINHVLYYGRVNDCDRELAVQAFNGDPDCDVFLGNPDCGGVGLNLQGQASDFHDCVYIHYFSQNWRPAIRRQSEKRPHRKNTRRPVHVIDWCVPDSIDEEIRARVLKKRIAASQIQDIRDLLKEVTKCLES